MSMYQVSMVTVFNHVINCMSCSSKHSSIIDCWQIYYFSCSTSL